MWESESSPGRSDVPPPESATAEDDGENKVDTALTVAVLDGDKVVIEFDYADGLKTSDSQELRVFEVAGDDGVFAPADAVIAEDKVILSSDVEAPEYVRYAWQPYTSANLVNGEGLPASTFFASISFSFSETLEPPRMATKGCWGLFMARPMALTSVSIRKPLTEGR